MSLIENVSSFNWKFYYIFWIKPYHNGKRSVKLKKRQFYSVTLMMESTCSPNMSVHMSDHIASYPKRKALLIVNSPETSNVAHRKCHLALILLHDV
jgi:hypothetical protein